MDMERMVTMNEGTARFTFTAACGLSIFAAGAAIVLRLRAIQGPALMFLVLAFISCMITLISYRRYKLLRDDRWKGEIKRSADELGQVLNHARMNIIMEHVTGPLTSGSAEDGPNGNAHAPGDNPIADK